MDEQKINYIVGTSLTKLNLALAALDNDGPGLAYIKIGEAIGMLAKITEQSPPFEPAGPPEDDQIRSDNPHFGPEIRIVENIIPYDGNFKDRFSHQITVGAHSSVIEAFAGFPEKIVDAWATYLYDTKQQRWVLGAN